MKKAGKYILYNHTERNSAIELLRIIAMALIVLHHITVHGDIPMGTGSFCQDLYFQFIAFGGRVGVWCFVMITGYFSIYQGFRLKKLTRLMGQCWFYSVLIAAYLTIFGIRAINTHEWILSLLPIGAFSWFAACYIVFYFFIPYINKLILSLKRNDQIKLMLAGVLLWFLIPTVGSTVTLSIPTFGNELSKFFISYTFGAFCRLNRTTRFVMIKPRKSAEAFFGLMIFYLFCSSVIYRLHFHYRFINGYPFYLASDSIFVILFSIVLFLFFINTNIGQHSWINNIAKATFGIYLLHDNGLASYYVWHTVFHASKLYGDPFVVIKTINIVISIFATGIVIDYLRIYLLDKPIFKRLNPYLDKVQESINRKINDSISRFSDIKE